MSENTDKIYVRFLCPEPGCGQKIQIAKPRNRKDVKIECPKCKKHICAVFDVTKDPQPVKAWIYSGDMPQSGKQPLRQQAASDPTCYPSAEDAARLRALAEGLPWPPPAQEAPKAAETVSDKDQTAQPKPATPPASQQSPKTEYCGFADGAMPSPSMPSDKQGSPKPPTPQAPQMHQMPPMPPAPDADKSPKTEFYDDNARDNTDRVIGNTAPPIAPRQNAGAVSPDTEMELPSPGRRPGPKAPERRQAAPANQQRQRYPIPIELYLTHVRWMGLNNRRYRLPGGSTIVGRTCTEKVSDIMIDGDDAMSRRSIEIVVHQSERGYVFVLNVLNAVNPVLLNDKELRPGQSAYLGLGDIIIIGTTKLKFDRQ